MTIQCHSKSGNQLKDIVDSHLPSVDAQGAFKSADTSIVTIYEVDEEAEDDEDCEADTIVKGRRIRKSYTAIKSLLNASFKRPYLNISGPGLHGPQTVAVISEGQAKCLIHSRPTKRPRTCYDQSHLYLKAGDSYALQGVKGGTIQPSYRDLYQNHALAKVLVEWMWDTIFGASAESLKDIISNATTSYHSILEHINPPSSAVFLALHYIEQGAQVGLAYNNFNANNLRGRSDQHISLYMSWLLWIALLVSFEHVSPEDVRFTQWVDKMYLEAKHIKTMERQFTMMLHDELSIYHSDWIDFLHSLLPFTRHSKHSAAEDMILDEITLAESFYKDATRSFILASEKEEEERDEDDINHKAVVLTILIAHTINVNFDEDGVPCVGGEARELLDAGVGTPTPSSPTTTASKGEVKAKSSSNQSLLGNGQPVFTPPSKKSDSDGEYFAKGDDDKKLMQKTNEDKK
ncbi:hypothetical protein MPER_10277 [Moniliophthora perniciosa FA553]|nr:hypothetical protein MPER_10277 [Moniliophthora perniciosa FA553]